MYTLGKNCDVRFNHPDVNSGQPFGFLFAYDPIRARQFPLGPARGGKGSDHHSRVLYTHPGG